MTPQNISNKIIIFIEFWWSFDIFLARLIMTTPPYCFTKPKWNPPPLINKTHPLMFPMACPAKLQTCAYFPFFFACPFLPILLIDSKPILDILLVPYSLKKHSVPIPKKKMFLMKTHLGGITSSSFQNIFSRKHCPLFKATLLPKDHFI